MNEGGGEESREAGRGGRWWWPDQMDRLGMPLGGCWYGREEKVGWVFSLWPHQVLSAASLGMRTGVWLALTLPLPRFRTSPSPWRFLSCGRTGTSSMCAAWRPSCGAWMRGSGQLTGPSRPRASRCVLQGSGQRSKEELGLVPITSRKDRGLTGICGPNWAECQESGVHQR